MGGWGGVETALLMQQCLEETKDKNIHADRQHLVPTRQDLETTKQ